MKLEQSFEVAAPLERVWAALIDVEHVAPCLPGASVTGRNDDGSYNGSFKVKIGPTSAAYSGKLLMEDVDESAHTATMNASGHRQARPGRRQGDDRLQGDRGSERRHHGRGGHRLPHHRPPGPLWPRRDDRGDLQPPAGPVRRHLQASLVSEEDEGAGPRTADDPHAAETASADRRAPRRPTPSRAAARRRRRRQPPSRPTAAEPTPASPPQPSLAVAEPRPAARHRRRGRRSSPSPSRGCR